MKNLFFRKIPSLARRESRTYFVFFLTICFFLGANTTLSAQQNTLQIKGTIVSEEDKEPIIGATILEIGTSNGTVSDLDGNFQMLVTSNATLRIAYVGCKTQNIQVKNDTPLKIRLVSESFTLEDVVVVGYGTQKKVNLTGAVASVSMKELENRPVTNVVEALQGTTPGLVIQQSNSQPGSRPSINVRGVNTLNNNDPMVLIDGIIGDIQNVNPSDIESISVLKDASSTAIYGSRASNGVILITTKKGTKGAPQVTYDFLYGLQTPTALPDIADSWVYAELRNEALANSGKSIQFTPDQIRGFRENGPNVNWMKEIFKSAAPQQSHNLSVSAGDEKTTYMASMGYMNQNSLFEGPDYGMERINMRLNMESKLSERLKVNVSIGYARNKITDHAYWTEWILEQAIRMPPIYPIKDEDGNYTLPSGSNTNALARLEEGGYRENKNDDLSGVVNAQYKLMDGLMLKGMVGGQLYNNRMHENRKSIPGTGDKENRLTENSERIQNLTTNLILTYDKTFNKAHTLGAMVGYAYEGGWNNKFETYRIVDSPDYDIMGGAQSKNTGNQGWASDWSIYSAFLRLNYNFKEKYLFEFNLRDDLSSKFAKGNRSGLFPSLSGAWRISEENFYSDNLRNIMPSLKLRSSWGLVGNNRIDDYQYQSSVSVSNGYNFGNNVVNTAWFEASNPDLKWETTQMFNVGTDISFLNNALTLSADYFVNDTYDILIKIPVPGVYGGGAPIQNAGKVRNSGWELALRYNLKTGDFNHTFSGNLSDSKNKVLDVKGTRWINGTDINTIVQEGYPINSYYAYRWDGFFQNEAEVANGPQLPGITPKPGDIRYIDKNDDGLIKEDDDRFVLGNPYPRFTFGFNYSVQWKGFDFSMLWQGVGQRSIWIRGESAEAFHNNNEGPVFNFHIDRWTPNNTDATYPRLTVGAESNNNAAKSDFWIQNAAYLRLKNIQMGYTLPKTLTRKISIQNLRVFATIQNALTFSNMKGGLDPETSGSRVYPVSRVYSLGLNLKF